LSVSVICGTNDYARAAKLQQLTTEFVAEFGDFGLERIDGESVGYDRLLEAVSSLPFLADQKLVVVKNLSQNKAVIDKFEPILEAVSSGTRLVLVESKLDKRGVYYKTLKKLKDFQELNNIDPAQLGRWLVEEVKSRGGSLSLTDANYLIARVGESQQLLSNEITKLLFYTPQISRQTIDLLTEPTPSSTIFELMQAAFEGRTKQALKIYDEQRLQRVEPQAILALFAWQLHLLSLIKTAKGRGANDIAASGGVSPFAVGRSMSIASKVSIEHLKSLVHEALVLDTRIKSESINVDGALKNLILKISN
jgi:DNA polymerase III subunit delta